MGYDAPAPPDRIHRMLLLAFLLLTSWPVIAAARANPTPKTLARRNFAIGFLAFAMLVSGGYTLGKDMALSDAASATLKACKV